MMRAKLKMLCATVIALCAVGLVAAPGYASARADSANYLNKLEAIAGRPADYVLDGATSRSPGPRPRALDPYLCNLHPSVVHLRKSGNYNVVGAKPYTKCTAGTPTSITQTSTLYIVEWAGLVYNAMLTKTSGNYGQKSYTQENVAWACYNKNSSVFQQKTNGVSVQAGKTYRATVQTTKVSLGCGY